MTFFLKNSSKISPWSEEDDFFKTSQQQPPRRARTSTGTKQPIIKSKSTSTIIEKMQQFKKNVLSKHASSTQVVAAGTLQPPQVSLSRTISTSAIYEKQLPPRSNLMHDQYPQMFTFKFGSQNNSFQNYHKHDLDCDVQWYFRMYGSKK